MPIIAVPIKPFGIAKTRLASLLDGHQRARLGQTIALRTIRVAASSGHPVAVVTADPSVARWAGLNGLLVIEEPEGGGLNGAAQAAAGYATSHGTRWIILHADLPLLSQQDISIFVEASRLGPAVAPSYDGGTSAVSGLGNSFSFSYGPGSFHRHLAQSPTARVVVRLGLVLDLDGPDEYRSTVRHPRGSWMSG